MYNFYLFWIIDMEGIFLNYLVDPSLLAVAFAVYALNLNVYVYDNYNQMAYKILFISLYHIC